MSIDQKKAISVVNDIIHYLEDGKKGFMEAADKIEDKDLKTMFHIYAQQRAEMSANLQKEVIVMGGEPAENDEWKGKVHRLMMGLKAAITRGDNKQVLDEVERGDEAAVEKYEEALNSNDLPHYLVDILNEQFTEIKNNLRKVRQLKMQRG